MLTIPRTIALGASAIFISLAVQACSSDPAAPAGNSEVQILLTDAPSDLIAEARVWISRVYLQGGAGDNAPRVDLFNDPANPKEFDLLELQNGVTAALTPPVDVDAGNYRQLRLIVDSARVTLVDGTTFSDGTSSRRMMVPSGAQSGIKVDLAGVLEAEEGELVVVTVDFDVAQNFVLQGNPDTPAGLMGVIFTPRLVEKGRQTEPANGG